MANPRKDCEVNVLGTLKMLGLATVALRFGNVYGRSALTVERVAKFFKDVADGGEVTIDGDRGQTRDFVFVGDLCRAILLGPHLGMAGLRPVGTEPYRRLRR